MPHDRVIRLGADGGACVEPESWRFVGVPSAAPAEDAAEPAALPGGPIVVPFARWSAERDALSARRDPVGVWLGPNDDPLALAGSLDRLALVAVFFPKFTDGRGYSTAVLLRKRLGYRGELRAFGDVGRDQLFYLRRCGFDSFALAPHRDPEAALESLAPFSVRYQGAVDDPRPLFARG